MIHVMCVWEGALDIGWQPDSMRPFMHVRIRPLLVFLVVSSWWFVEMCVSRVYLIVLPVVLVFFFLRQWWWLSLPSPLYGQHRTLAQLTDHLSVRSSGSSTSRQYFTRRYTSESTLFCSNEVPAAIDTQHSLWTHSCAVCEGFCDILGVGKNWVPCIQHTVSSAG